MKKVTKILALMLAAVTLLSVMAVPAFAEYTYTMTCTIYYVNGKGAQIASPCTFTVNAANSSSSSTGRKSPSISGYVLKNSGDSFVTYDMMNKSFPSSNYDRKGSATYTVEYAFFPIATAYFSSAIINSLISKDAYRKTVLMVLIFLLIQLIWRLVLYIISKQIQMKKSIWNNMCANYINRISSKMDYEHFENPRVNEIYTRVCSANDNREGLYAINGLFGQFISNITKVCSCFALFASIIVGTSVGTEKGWLYFVNSSYMTILFIVILIVKAILQCKTDSKMTKKVYDVWGETARENMFFGRLFSLGTDFRNGMTLRIFNEDKLILKNTRDFVKKSVMICVLL